MTDDLEGTIVVLSIFVFATFIFAILVKGATTLLRRYQVSFEHTAKTNLTDLFLFVDPTQLLYLNFGSIMIIPPLVYALTENPVFTVIAAGATLAGPRFIYKYMRQKRYDKFEEQLPDALLMIAGGMKAGASLPIALESVVAEQYPPLSQEFDLFLRELRLGVDFDSALIHMTERLPIQDFHLVAAAIRIAREVGGNLSEVLDSLAETLRRKHTMEGKIKSLTAQGKLQGIVMTSLPILLMLVLMKIEPEAMAPLFNTWLGYGVMAVIIFLEGIGYFFIRKITTIDV